MSAEALAPGWTVEGDLTTTLEVGEHVFEGTWCWHCKSVLYHDLPMPIDYGLWKDGKWFWDWPEEFVFRIGEEEEVWIKPLPLTKMSFDEKDYSNAQFNAYLENWDVIIAAEVENSFDVRHGGHRITVSARDTGNMELYVSHNWAYGQTDIGIDAQHPICTSSHMSHEYSECDKIRSYIGGTKHTFIFEDKHGNRDKLALDPNAPRCTTADVPGRWLGNRGVTKECVVPYCSGNRVDALISSMSWQGAIRPWLWVPYSCYFHYYDEKDISYCAGQ